MGKTAFDQLVEELSSRASLTPDVRRSPHSTWARPVPDLASIRVLSERHTSSRAALAVAFTDIRGGPYYAIRAFVKHCDELRSAGGCEWPDRDVGVGGARLNLYACANGPFIAGGRVQGDGLDIARVRLVWEDG